MVTINYNIRTSISESGVRHKDGTFNIVLLVVN